MANISFGQNILPKTNNTYTLGNSSYKWHAYLSGINGTAIENLILPTVDSTDNGKILKVSSGAWTVGDAPSGLPSVSSTDNGKILSVSSGDWVAITPSYLTSHQDITGKADKNNTVLTGSLSLGRKANTTIGTSSTALGTDTTASDSNAHAEGSNTTASSYAAHSEGSSTTASGMYSHAEGSGSVASGFVSHAEGSSTTASGMYSHAEGQGLSGSRTINNTAYEKRANGQASHVEGNGSLTYGNFSHAEGDQTNAIGQASHSEGQYTIALESCSHAEGYSTRAFGSYAHAEGYATIAEGMYSHAEGYGDSGGFTNILGTTIIPKASGLTDHIEGYGTYTSSGIPGNHAEGNRCGAIGGACHAEGNGNIAEGAFSHVEGQYNIASGSGSHVGGKFNVIDNYDNWTEWAASTSYNVGDKVKVTTTSNDTTTVSGYICKTAHTSDSTFNSSKWNFDTYINYAHIIGNGTTNNARSNAYALTWDGTGRYAGDLYVNCDTDSTNGDKVATEAYVTTAINNASIGGGSGGSDSGLPVVSSSDNGKILQVSSGAWSIVTPNFLTSHQDISGKANSADLATVATSGSYNDLLNKPDLSSYLTSVPTMTGATSSAAGTAGLVPAPATTDVDKFLAGDGTYKSGGLPMVILSYGSSTWAEFEAAYKNNVIVYTRASSNSNPATGSQTRMAFMAYVNNATTPTEVEFQYYRSMSSHSATAMGDQVFVYKLTKASGWSVTTRDASIKEINVASGSKLGVSWSSNKVTLSNTMTANDMPMSSSDNTTTKAAIEAKYTKPSGGIPATDIASGVIPDIPAITSSDNGKVLRVVNGAWSAVSLPSASGVSF